MSRTRVRWRRLAVTAACSFMVVGGLAGRAGAGGSRRPPSTRVYLVQQGDSLWRIAVELVGHKQDPRPMVQRLIEANHVHDGRIVAGQELRLP